MSAKSKRTKKTESGEAPAPVRAEPFKPKGRPPMASVSSRHGSGMITRHSKGFSLTELGGVGLGFGQAKNWGVPVDLRRRSTLEPNMAALKKWYQPPAKPAPKAAPSPSPKAETKAPKLETKKTKTEIKATKAAPKSVRKKKVAA